MQKKILSFLLVFALFLSLALPAAAAETEVLEICGGAQPLSVVQPGQQSKRPWDYIGETSLIEAMPATRDLAVQLPSNVNLLFLLRDSGSADTYFCVDVYGEGSNEPLATVTDIFPGVEGIYTYEILWRTKGFATGAYRVVMYSATRSGETYTPVAGTQSEVVILLTDWQKPLESISLIDPDTRQPVSTLGLALNEMGCLEIVENPSYNTYTKEYACKGNPGGIGIEIIGGLMVFTPDSPGWGKVKVEDKYGNSLCEITVEVCINSGGHINQEQLRIAQREGEYEGVILHYCPDCGCSYLETEESYAAAMGKFVDLSSDQWYYDGVKAMVTRGLFNGVSTYHFRPDSSMTRAMLVTVLWRYAGAPEAGKSAFMDVPDGLWYSEAISWAAEQGVVSGIGQGKFDPEGNVTREQMATILYRYAKVCGFDTALDADVLSDFPDKDQVSGYALEPLQWAVSNGIITGTKTGRKTLLDPRGFATRAQLAVILSRYIDKYDPDPATLPIPDLDQALEHGSVQLCTWAFFPDGTLVLQGSSIPDFTERDGQLSRPWEHLTDQVTRVVVQEGVEQLGTNSLARLPSLTEVELPSTLRHISSFAFACCTALERIDLPYGVRFLGDYVFTDCSALKEVNFPDSLYQRSNWADSSLFANCTSLETVTLPPAFGMVNSNMFYNCTALKEVTFGIGTWLIDREAFVGCSSLETVVFPLFMDVVYDEAFVDCPALKNLVFLNPWMSCETWYEDDEGNPVYVAPFGDPEITTVYAFSNTEVAILAEKLGYNFVPLESVIE